MGIQDYSSTNTHFIFPSLSSSSSSSNQVSPMMHHHVASCSFNPLISSLLSPHGGLGANTWAGSDPFGVQSETGQETMEAKAAAASKSHSEAERRRRQRINNHLTKLRTLLPSTTKTDKASLLAEVIQHLKELKRQTTIIAEQSPVPTETNELTIDNIYDEEGRTMIRASLCCEDRSDLLPDLIKTLKMLQLRTLKAEITTLGRRVKNVLFVTSDAHSSSIDDQQMVNYTISVLKEAFEAVIEKTYGDQSSFGSVKRQRTNNIDIIEHYIPR